MQNNHAAELHQRAIVIDGHCDILSAVADGRMRLCDRVQVEPPESWQGAAYVRMPPNITPYDPSPYSVWYECMGQYDIPRWREGGVTMQVTAIFVSDDHLHRPLERALDQTAAFHREIEANPDSLLLATSADDIRRAKAEDKTALLLSFEGGEPLGRNLDLLDIFYRLGLRMVSLTHSRRNDLADGTQLYTQTGGLTQLGQELIRRMNTLGMVVDLAHLSNTGVWEVLELSTAPVIYSHTTIGETAGYKTALTAIDSRRQTSKLRALADKGGVACAIFVAQPDVNAIVDAIDTMIQHVGEDHVGIGTDFVSLAHVPADLADVSQLPRLTDAMVRRGFSDEAILKVLGGNLLRVFETVLR
ncbi:MAG: dipeptidase [Chloroflexi bacterium]|nr:dipeptidase [Chloroflexota bacterium]